MEIDEKIVDLITELEYIIGNSTYNPNSVNGYTGEEGCSYRYPVNYCKSPKDKKKQEYEKTKGKISIIDKECIDTINYQFGTNHQYVGISILEMLELIEHRYGIDFNELEQSLEEKRKKEMARKKRKLNKGEVLNLSVGKYYIGIDLPKGEYLVTRDKCLVGINVYDKRRKMVDYLLGNKLSVVLKAGYMIEIISDCCIQKKG